MSNSPVWPEITEAQEATWARANDVYDEACRVDIAASNVLAAALEVYDAETDTFHRADNIYHEARRVYEALVMGTS